MIAVDKLITVTANIMEPHTTCQPGHHATVPHAHGLLAQALTEEAQARPLKAAAVEQAV
jgi:hypothetical protein